MPDAEPAAEAENAAADDQVVSRHADYLREQTPAFGLCGSLSAIYGARPDPRSYRRLVEQELAAAGNPTDPLERMLVEQAIMAHATIARLYFDAGVTTDADQRIELLSTVPRLAAELRRTVLAVSEYRDSARSRLRVVGGRQKKAPRRAVS